MTKKTCFFFVCLFVCLFFFCVTQPKFDTFRRATLGRDLLPTRWHYTVTIIPPCCFMGCITPHSATGKGKFPWNFVVIKFYLFQSKPPLQKLIFIFLPSWTKQINSKVGISPFITRADILKEQNENRSWSNPYALTNLMPQSFLNSPSSMDVLWRSVTIGYLAPLQSYRLTLLFPFPKKRLRGRDTRVQLYHQILRINMKAN